MKNKLKSLSLALSFCIVGSSLVSCSFLEEPVKEYKYDSVYDALTKLSKSNNYMVASNGNLGIRTFENIVGYTEKVYNFADQIYVDDELAAELNSGFVNIGSGTAFYTYDSKEDKYIIDGIYDATHGYKAHVKSFSDLHLDNEDLKNNASDTTYVFNLRNDAQGQSISQIDNYNAYIIGEMIHLGSPIKYIDDLQISLTSDGIQIDLVIEGLVQGMQNLDGQITVTVIENAADEVNSVIEKQAAGEKDKIKVLKYNDDYTELKHIVNQTYQVNIPTVNGDFVDVYYGKDYFAINAEDTELIHKINKEGKIELYATNARTKKLEYLDAETKEIQKIQDESNLDSDEILEVMAKQIASIGYLKNLPEFNYGGLFATGYGQIFEDDKKNGVNGILIEDMYHLTGICDAIDKELEWNCFAPYRLLGTGFGWDKNDTPLNYEDDKLTMFIVTFEGAGISKLADGVSFNKFGVEYPGIEDLTPTSVN